MKGFARERGPAGEGGSLTGDTQPGDVPSLETRPHHGLPHHLTDLPPEALRVEFTPAGAWHEVVQRTVGLPHHRPRHVVDEAPDGGGAHVNTQHILTAGHHEHRVFSFSENGQTLLLGQTGQVLSGQN